MQKKIVLIIIIVFNFNILPQNLIQFKEAGFDPNNSQINNNEPSVSVNPVDPSKIVIATNYRVLQNNIITSAKLGVYYSSDLGENWNTSLIPSFGNYAKYADPSIAHNSRGHVYACYLGTNDGTGGLNNNGNSGVYFYSLITENFSQTKKMILLP